MSPYLPRDDSQDIVIESIKNLRDALDKATNTKRSEIIPNTSLEEIFRLSREILESTTNTLEYYLERRINHQKLKEIFNEEPSLKQKGGYPATQFAKILAGEYDNIETIDAITKIISTISVDKSGEFQSKFEENFKLKATGQFQTAFIAAFERSNNYSVNCTNRQDREKKVLSELEKFITAKNGKSIRRFHGADRTTSAALLPYIQAAITTKTTSDGRTDILQSIRENASANELRALGDLLDQVYAR